MNEERADFLSQSKATPPDGSLQSNRRYLFGTDLPRRSQVGHMFCAATKLYNAQIAVSDGEIAADLLVIQHMRLLGRFAQLFNRDRIEIGEKGFARPAYGRINHPLKQHRV